MLPNWFWIFLLGSLIALAIWAKIIDHFWYDKRVEIMAYTGLVTAVSSLILAILALILEG